MTSGDLYGLFNTLSQDDIPFRPAHELSRTRMIRAARRHMPLGSFCNRRPVEIDQNPRF